jgi:hypothetical protein
MMFFPGSIADVVASIRDIFQNSARYKTIFAQMAILEKRMTVCEVVIANCSKNTTLNSPTFSDKALTDIAADLDVLLRRQNEFIASVSKHLNSHDSMLEQFNTTVVRLWHDINILQRLVNDAAAEFNTTKRLIDAFEKNAATTIGKNNRGNFGSQAFGPDEPVAFESMIDEDSENEETENASPQSVGVGGSLNPDGSTPVLIRPKDAPRVVFELHEEGFEKAMQEGHQLVVMFYAPWCPHCKSALGPFEIAGRQSEVGFARINGDEFPEV